MSSCVLHILVQDSYLSLYTITLHRVRGEMGSQFLVRPNSYVPSTCDKGPRVVSVAISMSGI